MQWGEGTPAEGGRHCLKPEWRGGRRGSIVRGKRADAGQAVCKEGRGGGGKRGPDGRPTKEGVIQIIRGA